MTKVLLTAYEPYEEWDANVSWLTLVEFTKENVAGIELTTRLYPVDYAAVRDKLAADMAADFDYSLHLGQAPGASAIQLEAIGVNVAGRSGQSRDNTCRLADDGAVAYRSSLPIDDWAANLRRAGIPAKVSYHAGTFLCNAALYMSHYFAERQKLRTRSTFLHLPLDTSQVCRLERPLASLPVTVSAQAIRLILEELAKA